MWIVRCCGGAFLWSGQASARVRRLRWGFVPPRSFLGERVGGAQSVDERVLSTGGDSVVVLLGVEADSVLHEYFI
ncbi:hypothetical protein QP572_08525 [Brevibacterium sp. UMB10442]|nr:hypothetical protein [Brevibacterium sp. UMB10442]